MQESVHFTPSSMQPFEGKPPPSRWVQENLTQYIKLDSSQKFLGEVKNFLQELQTEQLVKGRNFAKGAKPSYQMVPTPKKGGKEEFANTSSFNAMQLQVGKQIESFQRMAMIVKEGNPSLSKEMDDASEQLQQIAKSFPKLTEEQGIFLSTLTENMNNTHLPTLSSGKQSEFWQEQMNMLQKMFESTEKTILELGDELQSLEQNVKQKRNVKSATQSLSSSVQAPVKPETFSQMLSQLQTIYVNRQNLSPKEKESLNVFLKALGKVKGKNGVSLPKLTGESLLQEWTNKFVQEHPNASRSQIQGYLDQLLDDSGLGSTKEPFFQEMGSHIRSMIEKPDFPATEGEGKVSFASMEGDKVVRSEQFSTQLAEKSSIDESTTPPLLSTHEMLQGDLSEGIGHTQAKIVGYQETRDSQKAFGAKLGASAADAASKGAGHNSLQHQFAQAILKHYMPDQVRYLRNLAFMLYFDQFGAGIGNDILTHMIGFGTASNDFNISGGLIKGKDGKYTGSPSSETNKISTAKAKAKDRMNQLEKILQYIKKEIQEIQNNPKLTASEKSSTINKLKGFADDASVCLKQVTNLYNIYSQLHVNPVWNKKHTKKIPNEFTISDPANSKWSTTLADDENYVVNGNTKSKPPGGLPAFQANVTSFQTNFSDQSQTQQMMLQMRMTEIQQEWTVVSTVLSALNQLYTYVAQNIYK
ncbi:MAG: hypothetical protein K940chlam9_00375 [Chlamydiae bacterium]|nr:hypothetical protein [Chlamydiota bacterium]